MVERRVHAVLCQHHGIQLLGKVTSQESHILKLLRPQEKPKCVGAHHRTCREGPIGLLVLPTPSPGKADPLCQAMMQEGWMV